MKKMYIIPETKVSEFKGQELLISLSQSLSIDDRDKADGEDGLSRPRGDEEWGDLWN